MSRKIEARKSKILADLVETRQMIVGACLALPAEKRDDIFLGVWSIKDLLAHLVGWDVTNYQAAQEVLSGKLPEFYAHFDHDWRSYNAHLVTRHKVDNFDQQMSDLKHSHQQLVDYLRSLADEDFSKDTGVRYKGVRVIISRLLQAEIGDERTHYEQIKEFLGNA